MMRDMTQRLQSDPELAAAYRRAHEYYLAERDAIEPLGTTFSGGGMPARVKCLHVVIAHSLAKGPGLNPLGDEALALVVAAVLELIGVSIWFAVVPGRDPFGLTERGRTLYVNGLYRHGFMMAPALAEMVADYLESGANDARVFLIEAAP